VAALVAAVIAVSLVLLFVVGDTGGPGNPEGNALREFSAGVTWSGEALVNAPADIGFGGFTNTTRSPVVITGVSLRAPGSGFHSYRIWTANSCTPARLVIHFNGDPRLVINSGAPSLRVFPFQSIHVPSVGIRPTVPSGEGPTCSELFGGSPLYYIVEFIPTKAGVHELKGFDVSYTWEGRSYQQYEPYGFLLDVRSHRYWKGPPTMTQFWGRGLPPP
jgi:hypothetical protein